MQRERCNFNKLENKTFVKDGPRAVQVLEMRADLRLAGIKLGVENLIFFFRTYRIYFQTSEMQKNKFIFFEQSYACIHVYILRN